MTTSTYVSYSPAKDNICAGRQQRAAALLSLASAVKRAADPSRSSIALTYQTRNELMRSSAAFKETIGADSDECVYDLATLLDLMTMTAFGAELQQSGNGLELMQRTIDVLQRQLDCATRTAPTQEQQECSQLIEEIWAWLGDSNGLSGRI